MSPLDLSFHLIEMEPGGLTVMLCPPSLETTFGEYRYFDSLEQAKKHLMPGGSSWAKPLSKELLEAETKR